MVIISDRLYVGVSIEDVKKDVIKGLKKKQFQPGLYCIITSGRRKYFRYQKSGNAQGLHRQGR